MWPEPSGLSLPVSVTHVHVVSTTRSSETRNPQRTVSLPRDCAPVTETRNPQLTVSLPRDCAPVTET
jgi:hypothetical protein